MLRPRHVRTGMSKMSRIKNILYYNQCVKTVREESVLMYTRKV